MKPLFFAEQREIFQTNLSNGPHKHKKGKRVKKYKRLLQEGRVNNTVMWIYMPEHLLENIISVISAAQS